MLRTLMTVREIIDFGHRPLEIIIHYPAGDVNIFEGVFMNKMLTLKQAAETYGLSYYAVRQLALSGAIPAIRIGKGKILVNENGLSEYLTSTRLTDYHGNEPEAVSGIRILGR